MQTLLMTMVLLSLAGALFLLIIFYDMRLEKWNWNILALLFFACLLQKRNVLNSVIAKTVFQTERGAGLFYSLLSYYMSELSNAFLSV